MVLDALLCNPRNILNNKGIQIGFFFKVTDELMHKFINIIF